MKIWCIWMTLLYSSSVRWETIRLDLNSKNSLWHQIILLKRHDESFNKWSRDINMHVTHHLKLKRENRLLDVWIYIIMSHKLSIPDNLVLYLCISYHNLIEERQVKSYMYVSARPWSFTLKLKLKGYIIVM